MAENGFQAIEKAKQLLPDVILLDVMMPGMTGFEVCERIRSDPQMAEIPIIILTALDDRESLLNALKAGADDFISKPFDRYELRARLIGITRLNRYQKLLQERAKLQEANAQLLNAYEATIEGLSHAMDLRDRETEGHSRRVTELTVKLAQALNFSEEEILHIRRGALLHDMGKIGIPDSILHKPDSLTEEEWTNMRKHPQFAYDMLSPIEYLRPALDHSLQPSREMGWNGLSARIERRGNPHESRACLPLQMYGMLSRPTALIAPPGRKSRRQLIFANNQGNISTRRSSICSSKWWKKSRARPREQQDQYLIDFSPAQVPKRISFLVLFFTSYISSSAIFTSCSAE